MGESIHPGGGERRTWDMPGLSDQMDGGSVHQDKDYRNFEERDKMLVKMWSNRSSYSLLVEM